MNILLVCEPEEDHYQKIHENFKNEIAVLQLYLVIWHHLNLLTLKNLKNISIQPDLVTLVNQHSEKFADNALYELQSRRPTVPMKLWYTKRVICM
jgi:hypothetical protein